MKIEKAIFAAGCFWGVQFYFDQVPGVTKTTAGYIGGHTENPSYEDVCSHTSGHAEAVEIEFDPQQVSYETLLKQFFNMHDPTQLNRQGPDVGDSYRSAIFYSSSEEKKQAEEAKKIAAGKLDKPVVTEIAKAKTFWPAEDFHQKFTERTGHGMCHIPYKPL